MDLYEVTKADYFRVKHAAEKEPMVAKVVCQHCGYWNDPTRTHRRKNEKYFRCRICGCELKSPKDDFKDKLLNQLKEVNK